MFVALLPAERYGQFCSAQAMLQSLLTILATPLAGLFLDRVGNYRYAFFLQAVLMIPGFLFMLPVYRRWQRYGGAKNYTPPPVDSVAVINEPMAGAVADQCQRVT
jgi:MFS family permease